MHHHIFSCSNFCFGGDSGGCVGDGDDSHDSNGG